MLLLLLLLNFSPPTDTFLLRCILCSRSLAFNIGNVLFLLFALACARKSNECEHQCAALKFRANRSYSAIRVRCAFLIRQTSMQFCKCNVHSHVYGEFLSQWGARHFKLKRKCTNQSKIMHLCANLSS